MTSPHHVQSSATPSSDTNRHPRYGLGVCIVLLAGLFLSLAGITIRFIESATGWQILFYRSGAFFVVVFLYLLTRYKQRVFSSFAATGRAGVIAAVSLGLGSACYVYALLLTTVANALLIISAAPILTAILGWIVLRERVLRTTWIAMFVAIVGICLMVYDGVLGGRLAGSIMAFGTVTSYAIMLVAFRSAKDRDMVPATCMAGIVGVIFAMIMADTLVVSTHDLLLCIFLGTVQYAMGFVLITIGSRYVPGAEVALLSLSEVILAPLWVWFAINETPSLLTIVGGGIVFTAVVAQARSAMGTRSSLPNVT